MRVILIITLTALLWGCGKANEKAVTVDSSGRHQPGWVSLHSGSYLQPDSNCKGCHGADLSGGTSGVSCATATFGGIGCHAGGPHPVPWQAHNLATDQLNRCSPCHGATLAGGTTAPACSKCHTNLPPGAVPVLGVCKSCHANPPDGALFPNISGAHKAHMQIPLFCSVCHEGGGSGSATHGKGLTIAFPAAYNAKSGQAVRNADGSCTNISCHGGQKTPLWRGGKKLDPGQDCVFCHVAGTTQYNSYNSGQHLKHVTDIGLICIDCHDMGVVSGTAKHFTGLQTQIFELSPKLTIKSSLNYVSGSCTPVPGSFSVGVCHSTKNW